MTKLTEEMVIARSRQSDLSTVKKLNCWGSELTDVSIIRRMRGVEVLALSVNKISGLADFENCQNLQELYLRRNNIKDLSELAYLQSLPNLKYLWLEENPCVERAGPNYRAIVLRTLPNLQKLDNVEVTPEELADARRGSVKRDDVIYEDSSYAEPPSAQRQQSPMRENQSLENTEESISDPIDRNSIPSSPIQRSPSNPEQYSPPDTNQPPSPRYQRDNRGSYNQYDVSMRSPGSDQEASPAGGYRERVPIAPSMSTHSMKEYYQSDYPKPHPAQYRHSQVDLTEWDEQQQQQQQHHHQHGGGGHPGRRNGGEQPRDSYSYRNGNANRDDWDENVEMRRRESRRSEGRFNDSASVVSNAVLNHYASYHRRPVNRNANLLSATLCLVKELDYPSLEVVEHAVRCRIDELATD